MTREELERIAKKLWNDLMNVKDPAAGDQCYIVEGYTGLRRSGVKKRSKEEIINDIEDLKVFLAFLSRPPL